MIRACTARRSTAGTARLSQLHLRADPANKVVRLDHQALPARSIAEAPIIHLMRGPTALVFGQPRRGLLAGSVIGTATYSLADGARPNADSALGNRVSKSSSTTWSGRTAMRAIGTAAGNDRT